MLTKECPTPQEVEVEYVTLSNNVDYLSQLNNSMSRIHTKLESTRNLYLVPCEACCDEMKGIESTDSLLGYFNAELEALHFKILHLKSDAVNLFTYIYNEETGKIVDELLLAFTKTIDFSTKSLNQYDANVNYILENVVLFDKIFEVLMHSLYSYDYLISLNKDILTEKVDSLYVNRAENEGRKLDKTNQPITSEFYSKFTTIDDFIENIYSNLDKINTLIK